MNTLFGFHAVLAALKIRPGDIERIVLQSNRQDQRVTDIVTLAKQNNIAIQHQSSKALNEIVGDVQHQGVVALCQKRFQFSEEDLPDILANADQPHRVLILDGVQDPHNLGACLRSANAFGVHVVIAPKDRAVGITPVVSKVACGAAEVTPFVQVTNLARTMRWLQNEGVWIVGASDQAESDLSEIDLKGSTAIVMGSEGQGMRRLTREHCDYLAKIPMSGTVSSLNVSVATGICLYELTR